MSLRRFIAAVLALGLTAWSDGCRQGSSDEVPSEELKKDRIDARGEGPSVEFPSDVRSDDADLNNFLDHLLRQCAAGEYGSYRLAVASEYEPLPRRAFERAWYNVEQVRVRKILKVHEPDAALVERPDIREELKAPIYCVHATIRLRQRPDRPVPQPIREVVVLVVQEQGEWKLGPPAPLALKQRIVGAQGHAEDLVAGTPETSRPSGPTATASARAGRP